MANLIWNANGNLVLEQTPVKVLAEVPNDEIYIIHKGSFTPTPDADITMPKDASFEIDCDEATSFDLTLARLAILEKRVEQLEFLMGQKEEG